MKAGWSLNSCLCSRPDASANSPSWVLHPAPTARRNALVWFAPIARYRTRSGSRLGMRCPDRCASSSLSPNAVCSSAEPSGGASLSIYLSLSLSLPSLSLSLCISLSLSIYISLRHASPLSPSRPPPCAWRSQPSKCRGRACAPRQRPPACRCDSRGESQLFRTAPNKGTGRWRAFGVGAELQLDAPTRKRAHVYAYTIWVTRACVGMVMVAASEASTRGRVRGGATAPRPSQPRGCPWQNAMP